MIRRLPRELAEVFEPLDRGDRLHVALRWATGRLDGVEAALPAEGDVLEVGCGHGLVCLLAASRGPGRRIHGVDIDAAKIAAVAPAVSSLPPGWGSVRFEATDPGWRPDATYDAVMVVDVLYLLGPTRAAALIADLAAALRPGGRLLVKEMDTSRRWKSRFTLAQEWISTRVTRITEGSDLELVPLPALREAMLASGLKVQQVPLDRWSPWPHTLLIGERPGGQ